MTIPKNLWPQLPTVNRHTHLASLDGVRGIAVILVLAVHFQTMGATSELGYDPLDGDCDVMGLEWRRPFLRLIRVPYNRDIVQ